jgi:hypothetical protein
LFIGCKLFTEIDGRKISPKIISKKEFNGGYEYRLKLPPGLSTADFNKKKQAIEEALKIDRKSVV